MIEELFPPGVITVAADEAMYEGELFAEERQQVAKAVRKRQREYTAGRVAARKALARLGIEDFVLVSGEDRVPRWPKQIVGSISHCQGYCGVSVARSSDFLSVGLDVEQSGLLKPQIVRLICTPAEKQRLNTLPAPPAGTDWPKLTFSAKESFYKCYYLVTRTFLDFQDAEIEWFPEQDRFVAHIIRQDKPAVAGLRQLEGQFRVNTRHIFTGVCIPADNG